MANTFTAKPFADGVVPTVLGALYTAPAGVVCSYLKNVNFFNSGATEQTIEVFINFSGTDRPWRRMVLAQYESMDLLDAGEAVHLGPNDIVKARTTSGADVHYFLTGVEEASN